LPKATDIESYEAQIANLQKQIDNLDKAHEELWNDVISGRSPLERNEEEIQSFRCEFCHELIDPVEEYHTHQGKKYYGHSKGEEQHCDKCVCESATECVEDDTTCPFCSCCWKVLPEEEGIGGWTFDCPKCNGTGKIGDSDCDKCDGTGGVYESGKHYKPEEGQNAWCYRHDKTVNEHNDKELDEDEEKGTENYEESDPSNADIWEGSECSCGCAHGVEDDRDICTELECECGHDSNWTTKKGEPDPSNPDKELDKDPDIPEPAEPTEPTSQHVTADGLDVPDKVEIPERLYNDLMMMIEYSTTNDNEAGGFLIKAKHGDLGVVGEQFGKDREIVLEPNEQLHEGEELVGTVHMHPVTPTASTGDVAGYLNDENEKVMVVVGADKSINVFFKTSFTAEGDYGDEISDNFEQSDMGMLAEGLGFIWYRGEESDRTVLNIITNVVDDVELNIVEETWPIEDLVKALGIKGRPDIPESYSTKKTPLKLQIPFSFRCKDKILTG